MKVEKQMNDNQAEGKRNQSKGLTQKVLGTLKGDDGGEAEGALGKLFGPIEEKTGDTKDPTSDILDRHHKKSVQTTEEKKQRSDKRREMRSALSSSFKRQGRSKNWG
jgi:uncharacterized protein YjbJ (UPF0337 family)